MNDGTADGGVVGPLRVVEGAGGVKAPLHVVPFDKDGRCTGPLTRELLVERATTASDVFVFCHGWNNPGRTAITRYDAFIAEYISLRAAQWPSPARPYQPVLAGILWPSTALVVPGERGPDIAGESAEPAGAGDLVDALTADEAATLGVLLRHDRLTGAQALDVARLVSRSLDPEQDDLGDPTGTPQDLLDAWRTAPDLDSPASASLAIGGFVDDDQPASAIEPATAGLGAFLDPRKLIRLATVLLMKDRAGRVGANGVAALLADIRAAAPDSRVHLVGHSYGCKVVLSAMCAPDDAHAVTVDSVLLLQGATSCFCFARAGSVPGSVRAGGYSRGPARSRGPVVCTTSSHDIPLTRFFHWAARRGSDLGEAQIAGLPPSPYAALGGYGPQGVDATWLDAVQPPTRYEYPAGPGIVGIRADGVIGGHGDVASRATAWMLLDLVWR